MPTIKINNKEYQFDEDLALIQACEQAGVEIPRFCYHEKLAVAGNCRMCLVEMENSPKPVASCALNIKDGMSVHTNTPMVQKAREGVMEFLLANHPLDCPICDQGGECDLQDQAFAYGKSYSRFPEAKRSVKDKYMGPLVETHMTRCIHCTRCVRFMEDIAGTNELGAVGRGEDMEITTYLERSITSELSGNIIDLCPVGALNSKPYAFKARSWELKKTESIDVLDAVGSNIRIDSRGLEVMRILPVVNDDVNEEWISDKTRFAYDGLKNQRLDSPMIRQNNKLVGCSWDQALKTVKKKLTSCSPEEIGASAGKLADCESMYALKRVLNEIGCYNHDANAKDYYLDTSSRGNYLFNTTINGIEESDLILLLGTNPRLVAPTLNIRIRQSYLHNNTEICRLGGEEELNYPVTELGGGGDDGKILNQILEGSHPVSEKLKKAEKPLIITGEGVLTSPEAGKLLQTIEKISRDFGVITGDWNGFNILHDRASLVAACDIGFAENRALGSANNLSQKIADKQTKVLYLLGEDELDEEVLKDNFIIYQGHHGDKTAPYADVILPGAAYSEKFATYLNLEGRPQTTRMAVSPPGEALEDWQVISKLAQFLGTKFQFSRLEELRSYIASEHPHIAEIDNITPSGVDYSNQTAKNQRAGNKSKAQKQFDISDNISIAPEPFNFYMTDVISRNSSTMAKCTAELNKKNAKQEKLAS
jgi:NADH-quinone oxidoreductase subunit G